MSNKRECANWIKSFVDWVRPRSEAPDSYIIWTAIWCIASALKRHVYIPKTILGQWNCFPNLYVFLVGPPGLRKTTQVDMLYDEIIHEIDDIHVTAQSATQQALMKQLADSDDFSLTIISKEFGNLYKASGPLIIEFLTALFDGNKRFDNLTLSRGVELASNPSANMIAATTPIWLAENFGISALQGGFASRIIWVYEDELRKHQLFYKGLNYDFLNKVRAGLIKDLRHVTEAINGEITLDDDLIEYTNNLYIKFMREEAPTFDARMQGYVHRKPRHILAVAICLHFAYSDKMALTQNDVDNANRLLTQLEPKMTHTFRSVGGNPYTLNMDEIVDYIKKKVRVKRQQLLARFNHVATPDVVAGLLDALVMYGTIGLDPTDSCYYIINKGEGDDKGGSEPLSRLIG